MKPLLKSLSRYFMMWLKLLCFAPVVVFCHLFRLVHGLYLLAVQSLLGMKDEADNLLDELLSVAL